MRIYIGICVAIFILGALGQVSSAIQKQKTSDGIAAVVSTLMAAAGIAVLIAR